MTQPSVWIDPPLATCQWGCGWEYACATDAEKQRREEAHRTHAHAGVVENVTDIRDRMLGEHPDERDDIIAAIRQTALAHPQRRVDANTVRPNLPAGVTPQMVGAVFSTLAQQGKLARVDYTVNTDRHGRNQSKPLQVWQWVGA